MQGELIFLAVVALPTIAAFIGYMMTRSTITLKGPTTPANYWGAYSNQAPIAMFKGVPVPETEPEEYDSASHMHTIGVHP